jgi:1,4-dihydroxy-2-naphthoate octaprenyltransferase
MIKLKQLFGPLRVPFLILPPACVALGWGSAVWTGYHIVPLHLLLVLIGAVAAHASVNAFNEYFDFKSGLDSRTTRTPFSGGSGTLQAHPALALYALGVAIVTLLIVWAVGIFFIHVRGPMMVIPGVAGSALVIAYTILIVKMPFWCLIAPGLGFGPIMVVGTNMALTGVFSWTALAASAVPFFLVSNLLLLNQFPDVEADRTVGRKHFPLILGRKKSSIIYGAFLALSYLSIIAGVATSLLPLATAAGLLTIALAIPAFRGAYRRGDNAKELVPSLGLNVAINIATPALMAAGLLISK